MYIVSLKTSPNMIFQDAGDISPTPNISPKYRQPDRRISFIHWNTTYASNYEVIILIYK